MSRQPRAPAEARDGAAHDAAPQLAQPAARAVHAVTHYHTLHSAQIINDDDFLRPLLAQGLNSLVRSRKKKVGTSLCGKPCQKKYFQRACNFL